MEGLREALAFRYDLDCEIGRGGMATVYRATDRRLGQPVAIKVLRSDGLNDDVATRFAQEIALTTRLHHPNILKLLDTGQIGTLPYYVMPFVSGETLRTRLTRERHLPIDDAIRITLEIADALAAAHRHGIVHRDIKPENILLEEGHVVVADFGIARALTAVTRDPAGGLPTRITGTGIGLGTPGYMSPEQAAGEDVDHRSDLYSLACVCYEMLAGEIPFTGPTPQAILTKQLSLPPPPLVAVRDTAPGGLQRFFTRALAKVRADRYQAVEDFVGALRTAARPTPPHQATRGRLVKSAATAGLVLVVALATSYLGNSPRAAADTTVYAVLPFDVPVPFADIAIEQRVHDALGRWQGLSVTAPVERPSDERAAARAGAGRYFRGTLGLVGDSLRLQISLFDAGQSLRPLATVAARLPQDRSTVDAVARGLVDRLLLRDLQDSQPPLSDTRSLPARQSLAAGMAALAQWDLPAADSAFTRAVAFDPTYSRAHVWIAALRRWSDTDPAAWRVAAEQAVLRPDRLAPFEGLMAGALLAEGNGRPEDACPAWEQMTADAPGLYVGWYGLALCRARDNAVVPDSRSPSGWRFRTSYHGALEAFQRAFGLRPVMLRSFRNRSYESLRRYFMTGSQLRFGLRDGTTFFAQPEWTGDTLALVPWPGATPAVLPVSRLRAAALREQRRRFAAVAIAWATAEPDRPEALEALAVALAHTSDPGAIDTLRRARALSAEPVEAFRLAAMEVWMHLAFGTPWDPETTARARWLADSLLATAPPDADPYRLAGLAVLTGRVARGANLARTPTVGDALGLPPTIASLVAPLMVFAAFAGPSDSLDALALRALAAIERHDPDPARRQAAVDRSIARVAPLAWPDHRLDPLRPLLGERDYVVRLQADLARADTGAVTRTLAQLADERVRTPPSSLTFDGLLPEAAVWAALGRPERAAAWLDPTLGGLAQIPPDDLADPIQAAALVRAFALRAEVAARLDDPDTAARWAGLVVQLWSDADAFLQPIVARMRILSRSGGVAGAEEHLP